VAKVAQVGLPLLTAIGSTDAANTGAADGANSAADVRAVTASHERRRAWRGRAPERTDVM
jgi:hypothetical protein